jgi:hypothetical protein
MHFGDILTVVFSPARLRPRLKRLLHSGRPPNKPIKLTGYAGPNIALQTDRCYRLTAPRDAYEDGVDSNKVVLVGLHARARREKNGNTIGQGELCLYQSPFYT